MAIRKTVPAQNQPAAANQPDEQPRLSAGAKALLSVVIAFHILAIFWAPFTFASNVGPSSSPFANGVAAWLRPYYQAIYADHGYFFFAPQPGPSHLVRYKAEFADGREPVSGTFPDLRTQRPRLLYHRHFMLAEAYYNSFAPPQPAPEPTPPPLTASSEERARYQAQKRGYQEMRSEWQAQRLRYEKLRTSFENHLKHELGAQRVTLTRVEHRLLLPDEFRELGLRPDDPQLYLELPENPPPEQAR